MKDNQIVNKICKEKPKGIAEGISEDVISEILDLLYWADFVCMVRWFILPFCKTPFEQNFG